MTENFTNIGLTKIKTAKIVKDIRRANRKLYSAEEKIRIVLEGLRGETTIAELCRQEGIAQSMYYKWSMGHVHGAPYHPQTQGKIEGWHQTLKNRVLLDNYYLPSQLEYEIGKFIDYYNHHRYHESLNNVTPADVYFGRDKSILEKRRLIKNKTIKQRRLQHRKLVA